MKIAVLVPLFKPGGRQVLLLKSMISSLLVNDCDAVVYIAADGPGSEVDWLSTEMQRIFAFASEKGIELCLMSFASGSGYPGCYIKLIQEALTHPQVTRLSFVDQDDYCLPNRFAARVSGGLSVASFISTDQCWNPLAHFVVCPPEQAVVLETFSPGMTHIIDRDLAERYLDLLSVSPAFSSIAHDYVICQMALSRRNVCVFSSPTMLYVQHGGNLIGYAGGLAWLKIKLKNWRKTFSGTLLHATLLDAIYGDERWIYFNRLHHNLVRSWVSRWVIQWRRGQCS